MGVHYYIAQSPDVLPRNNSYPKWKWLPVLLFLQTYCFFAYTSFSFFTLPCINLAIIIIFWQLSKEIFFDGCVVKFVWILFIWAKMPNICLGPTHFGNGLVVSYSSSRKGPDCLILIEWPSYLGGYEHHLHDMYTSLYFFFLLNQNFLVHLKNKTVH